MVGAMEDPRVSVIMATCGRPQFIGEAVKSILLQDYKSWELLVVDESDSAETEEAVAACAAEDPRILYMRKPHKSRIAGALNFGLQKARGEYIAILDDDDAWVNPNKLRLQVEFLDSHPDHVACGGGYIVVNREGQEKGRYLKAEQHDAIRKEALCANPMAHSTVLFRKSAASAVGSYDETLPQFADWDFWLKMGLRGKLYNFPEYFLKYRMWEGGASFQKQKEAAVSARRIVKHYKGKYPHYIKAVLSSRIYGLYVFLPTSVKNIANPVLSRLKKFLFSSRA